MLSHGHIRTRTPHRCHQITCIQARTARTFLLIPFPSLFSSFLLSFLSFFLSSFLPSFLPSYFPPSHIFFRSFHSVPFFLNSFHTLLLSLPCCLAHTRLILYHSLLYFHCLFLSTHPRPYSCTFTLPPPL